MENKKNKTKEITANQSYLEYFKEFWESKELFWILAKRDVVVRYKQTILGILWSVIRPLITVAVMVYAFGTIADFGNDSKIPYTLVVVPGVIVWLFFSQSLQNISLSLLTNANLFTKVYFPRLTIPFSSFILGLIDSLIAFIIFIVFCVYFTYSPTADYSYILDFKILLAPIILLLAYFVALGIGLFAAVLNVKYRDIGQIIPVIIQFGYFISPVGYTTLKAEEKGFLYDLFVLNPVTGVIDLMRWALLGDYYPFNMDSFLPMVIFIVVSNFFAIRFFRKHENSFVDFI